MRTKVLVVFAAVLLLAGLSAAQNQVQITKGPTVEHTDASTAVIAWSTNVNAGSQVKYGTDPNNLTQTAAMPWGGITHRVTVKNLQPGTTYYFQVVSGQAQGSGTQAMSNVSQFQTTGGANAGATPTPQPTTNAAAQPATGPTDIVAGPIPQQLTSTSATLWWETTAPTETTMRYGTDPNNLSQTASGAGNTQSHRVDLPNLQPGTTYYVSIMSNGQQLGNIGNFKTQPQGWLKDAGVDITKGPVIEYISNNEAVIAWSTNQKSSSVVRYGTDPNNLTQTAEAAWGGGGTNDPANTHRVHIRNLQPNTQYWFSIESGQAQGTGSSVASQKFPFKTVQNASAALRITQ